MYVPTDGDGVVAIEGYEVRDLDILCKDAESVCVEGKAGVV